MTKHGLARGVALMLFAAGAATLAAGVLIPAKAALGQHLLARAWDRAQAGDLTPRPWPWADTWPVAALALPGQARPTIVLAGANGETMAWGPAWLAQTPRPGEPGVSVIAAHRDTHFRGLERLGVGDRLTVADTAGARQTFRVTGTEIVRHDASGIEPHHGPARLALVTCWPFDAATPGPLRYVVWAEPEPPTPSIAATR